jgi:hypothetical protein
MSDLSPECALKRTSVDSSDMGSRSKMKRPPDGQIWCGRSVEPHNGKYFRFVPTQITSIPAAVSSHMRGVSRSSRTRDEMRWTRQREACDGVAGRIALRERCPARETTTLFIPAFAEASVRQARRGLWPRRSPRTVKSCGPDASTLASSLAEARSAQPGWTKPQSARRRWQKSPIAEESTK